jgi:hypothetical protein
MLLYVVGQCKITLRLTEARDELLLGSNKIVLIDHEEEKTDRRFT